MSPERYDALMSHLYAATRGEVPPAIKGEGVARMLLEVAELVCESGCGVEDVVEVDLWVDGGMMRSAEAKI